MAPQDDDRFDRAPDRTAVPDQPVTMRDYDTDLAASVPRHFRDRSQNAIVVVLNRQANEIADPYRLGKAARHPLLRGQSIIWPRNHLGMRTALRLVGPSGCRERRHGKAQRCKSEEMGTLST